MDFYSRATNDGPVHAFVNPFVELNAGLWSLFAGATVFLALRLWCKITRRHGLWYDDYILVISWVSCAPLNQHHLAPCAHDFIICNVFKAHLVSPLDMLACQVS